MKKLPIPSFVSDMVPTFVSDFAREHVPECIIDVAADALPVAATAAMILYPHSSQAALSLTKVSQVNRPSSSTYGAEQISGITYAGGDLFYAVDDNDGKMYPLTLSINRADGSLATSGIAIGTGVTMAGSSDMEGCAFDPASGMVWISQETSALIREYDPTTGDLLRSAPVPAIQKQYYGNYSLEALTISGDGKTMWTANEEALQCDGDKSTKSDGSVVRLTKFIRSSVRDNWTAAGQWAYLTQPIGTEPWVYNNSVKGRSGVSGLCALPDGTLLVLERTLWGDNAWDATFYNGVYQVDFSRATDVSGISSLKDATYTRATKTAVFKYQEVGWVNYEGLCLGPRLDDGSCSIVFVADGGNCTCRIMTLKLSGLDVRTVTVADAAGGASEPVGGPYRYVGGQTVTVEQAGATGPYSTKTRDHWLWYTTSGQEGTGGTASFVPGIEDTLTWNPKGYDASLPLLGADSFERLALETEAASLANWTGDGVVAAETYSVPATPGYPLADETHAQVLVVDGESSRDYASASGKGNRFDAMVRVTRERADSPVADAEGQLALYFDESGRATLQHRSADGASRLRTPLSGRVFADGDWVRVSVVLDYASDASGAAWCQVRLDGEPCRTASGVKSPADKTAGGSWHRLLASPATPKVSSVTFKGFGAVDDVALYESASEIFERSGASTTNGVPYTWLLEKDLPFDTAADVDDDDQDSRLEYAAGTDPWDAEDNFRVLDAGFNAAGRFEIRYTGSDARTNARLSVVTAEFLEDAADEDAWTPADGMKAVDGGTNVWTQLPTKDAASPSRFYKVRVTLPED